MNSNDVNKVSYDVVNKASYDVVSNEGVSLRYMSNRRDEPPLMKPPASVRGLNTPGGVQNYSHTTTGYKILGSRYNTVAAMEPATVPVVS